jgi:parallel beta-helix repeat protein
MLDFRQNSALTPSTPIDSSWPPVNKQYVNHMLFADRLSADIGAYGLNSAPVTAPVFMAVPISPITSPPSNKPIAPVPVPFAPTVTLGTIYRVGPSQPYTSIAAALSAANQLLPGDQLWIYARDQPYYEKFLINNKGTAVAPIVIRGIPDVSGNLPIIDGLNAITPRTLDYWNEQCSLLKIGGATFPSEGAAYIRVESLHFRNARSGNSYKSDKGITEYYLENALCILMEGASNIELHNNLLSNCGNGLFIQSTVRDILVQSNYIHNNGNRGAFEQHNVYSEAIGLSYRYIHFGTLISVSLGSNIKDRSGWTCCSVQLHCWWKWTIRPC